MSGRPEFCPACGHEVYGHGMYCQCCGLDLDKWETASPERQESLEQRAREEYNEW